MRRVYSIAVALSLSGCLLDTEFCGPDLVRDGDRCVPAVAPPPFREGVDAALGDVALSDAAPIRDAAPIPDARLPPHPWAEFNFIVPVDRTDPGVVRRTRRTPGTDLDAIEHGPADARRFASEVADWFLIEGPNGFDDPGQALGPPIDPNDPFLAVSLGGEGGYVAVPVELGRPFTWGDEIVVHVQQFDGAEDRFELFLCRAVPVQARDCLSIGRGDPDSRVTRFSVTP